MAALSSYRREGTGQYTSRTLECNWQEERERLAAGEKVQLNLMEGAVIAPLDPDLSIAPPTRVPGVKSDGRLLIPDRMTRSVVTNDSSRQGADDGYREYLSMNETFYQPLAERNPCPISHEPYYHGTFGGPIQRDDHSKTRVGPENRSKNVEYEPNLQSDGEKKAAKKMLGLQTFAQTFTERPTSHPTHGGFGSILPRHSENHGERMLTTTARASGF